MGSIGSLTFTCLKGLEYLPRSEEAFEERRQNGKRTFEDEILTSFIDFGYKIGQDSRATKRKFNT